MKDEEMLLKMYDAFALMAQHESDIVKKYKKVRKLHQEVYNSMGTYLGKHNIVPDEVCEKARYDVSLDITDKHQKLFYVELIIYPQYEEIQSLTEIYLEKHILRNEEKVKMLESMKKSKYSAFTIVKRNECDALVEVEDFFTHERFMLSDFNIGKYQAGMDMIYCARIIQYDDIYFQTGLSMLFKRNNVIKKWLKNHKNIKNWNGRDILELEEFYQKYGFHAVEIR